MQELLNSYLEGHTTGDEIINKLQELINENTMPNEGINSLYDGWNLIHYAAKKKDGKLLKFLINQGADIRLKTQDGENKNIFHLALQSENCGLDFIIVAWGHLHNSEINLYSEKDSSNKTPWEYLVTINHPEIFGTDSSRILRGELVSEKIAREFGIFNASFLIEKYSEDQIKQGLEEAIKAKNDSFIYELYHLNPRLSYPIIYKHLFSQSSGRDVAEFPKMKEIRNNELAFLQKAKNNSFTDPNDLFMSSFRININCLDEDGHNALEHAAQNKNINLCADLISKGIDVGIELCPSFCNLPKKAKDAVAAHANWIMEYNDERLQQKLSAITLWQESDKFHGDKITIQRSVPIFGENNEIISYQETQGEISLKNIYSEIFGLFPSSSLAGVADYFKMLAELVTLDENVRINIDNLQSTLIRSYSSRETARGNTVSLEGEIYIAAKDLKFNELVGIIAHEMCHFACYQMWNNDCKPYTAGSDEEKKMSAIYESLFKKFDDPQTKSQMNPTLRSAFEQYQGDGKEKVIKELIVRVPQIILENGHNQTGLQILQEQAPELLTYYQEIFIPKAREYIENQKSKIIEGKIFRIDADPEEIRESSQLKSMQKELDRALNGKNYAKAKEINGQIGKFIEQKLEEEKKPPTGSASKPTTKDFRSCTDECFLS